MRKRTIAGRLATTALVASVTALGTTASAGSAEPAPGVGTGIVSTSVLDAGLGNLLGLNLLTDAAGSTTDPKVGPAGASSLFTSLKLTSTIAGLNKTLDQHKVSAPGGPTEVSSSLLDLDSLGLGGIVTGTVEPILLKALSQPTMATASSARITDLGLLGGLVNLGVLKSTDQTGSGTASAEAARVMNLDALSVLDLGALLRGLGLDILNLPLSVVSGLVTSLGIPIDLKGATNLATLATSLNSSIDALSNTVTTTITTPVLGILNGLGLPLPLQPVLDTVIATAINTLKTVLSTLINTVVGLLDNMPILKLNALDISTNARATNSVTTSEATATGKLGGIQVGPLALPGLDLAAITSVVNGLLAQIQGALGGILAPLGISDLLTLRLFDRQTGVTEADGVVKAISSITGLVLKVNPPADLLGTITRLTDVNGGLGSLLPGAAPRTGKVSAAALTPAVAANPIEALLGLTSILSKGLELRVGTVQSQSLHSVPAVIPGTPAAATPALSTVAPKDLPRTGGEQTTLAFLALGLAASALGVRRLSRR